MNILATTAGAMVGGIWKIGAIVLAVVSIAACAYFGHGWYMAAHDRDQVLVERDEQRALAAEYQGAIREQNRAVETLAEQKRQAEVRGKEANARAEAKGKQYDAARERNLSARAETCDEAMPVVNDILGAIR